MHKPEVAEPKYQKKRPRKSHLVKKVPLTGETTSPSVADPPPPSRIVSQLMEMGFNRRRIEYAIQVSVF